MERKSTLKYGFAAVLVAIVVIAAALFVNPLSFLTPNQTSPGSFAIMLTDPPTVPAGTTVLNLTYSDISLHVVYANGTSEWLPVTGSGTVNLFSLINMSQTIASTTIPTNSTLDKIQFTITDVKAKVNGTVYNVTALSPTLVVSVANSQVNQTLSGVLVDFNPTLVQIQATDANGTTVYYYVLVPSATATIVTEITREQMRVGTIVQLGQNNRERLVRVVERFMNNITIVDASLSVNGNVTSFSVTVMNQGNITFRLFGLLLHGEFNATRTWQTQNWMGGMMDDEDHEEDHEMMSPNMTIPFKVNGSSLVPLFGIGEELGEEHDEDDEYQENLQPSSLTLQPGQNATLTFNGVITLPFETHMIEHPAIVLTPIADQSYIVRLMGEGFYTFNVTAK